MNEMTERLIVIGLYAASTAAMWYLAREIAGNVAVLMGAS